MIIAIPVSNGRLSEHFGHCDQFTLFLVQDEAIQKREDISAPPHAPGLLPRWLKEKGADLVIAGGMGRRAQELFRSAGIDVVCGAPGGEPEQIVATYLAGTLATGENACDH
jgi:predicted Fe-Mo cluster-binding NifX family protein